MEKNEALEVLHRSLVAYIEDSAGAGSEEAQEIEKAWAIIRGKVANAPEEEKITGDMILDWHGSDHDIEELAETMADIINGEYDIDVARQEIGDYEEDEEDE